MFVRPLALALLALTVPTPAPARIIVGVEYILLDDRRIPHGDDRVRLYEIVEGGTRRWVAWLEPGRLVLPGDTVPVLAVRLETGRPAVTVERTITESGRDRPDRETVRTDRGVLELSPTPVFVE